VLGTPDDLCRERIKRRPVLDGLINEGRWRHPASQIAPRMIFLET